MVKTHFQTTAILLLFLILHPGALRAEDWIERDLNFVKTQLTHVTRRRSVLHKPVNHSNLGWISVALLNFYQKVISSQDLPHCMFDFTCSAFSKYAIKKYGPFWGILMTFDRLLRCNGVGIIYYKIDPSTGKAIDFPIELYYLPARIDNKFYITHRY